MFLCLKSWDARRFFEILGGIFMILEWGELALLEADDKESPRIPKNPYLWRIDCVLMALRNKLKNLEGILVKSPWDSRGCLGILDRIHGTTQA